MQAPQKITVLLSSWRHQWKTHNLTRRLRDLFYQFILFLVVSLIILGAVAAVTTIFLPGYLFRYTVGFLALLYICLFGIALSNAVDEDRILFHLQRIEELCERLENNCGEPEIVSLRRSIDELTLRLGQI